MAALLITIFSDFVCPYSYVAESVLWRFERLELELSLRAFELFPDPFAPGSTSTPAHDSPAVTELAAGAGLVVLPPRFTPRTRKAHEAAIFARERGFEPEMRLATFAAYWEYGRDIGRIDVLTDLGREVGLDPDELKIALDIDRLEPEVLKDRQLASRLRVPGTPTIFLGSGSSARVLIGAQPADQLRRMVEERIQIRSP